MSQSKTYAEILLCCNPDALPAAERRLEETEEAAEEEYPMLQGETLRNAMCNATSETKKSADPSKPVDGTTEAEKPDSGASTFGFTALALVLVTA